MSIRNNLTNRQGKYKLDLQNYLVDYDAYDNFMYVPNTINASNLNSFLNVELFHF